jgi:hypothetical protein
MKLITKLLPVLLLTAFIFIFFLPSLTGGTFIASGMFLNDLMLFNYPLKSWYQEALVAGEWPFWTNLVGNGYPVFAEGQVGVFYPFHLLFFRFLPLLLAYNINMFLHFLFAGLFTYLFARQSLRLGRWSSLLSGLVYALNGFAIVHLTQINIVMLNVYLPLNFWLIHRLVQKAKLFDAFALALALAFQFHAGHAEMFYYNLLLAGVFFLTLILFGKVKADLKKVMALFVLAGVLFSGMALVQAWPTLELTQYSSRAEGVSYEVASSTLWPLKTLALFVNPRAYDIYRPELPTQMMQLSTAIIFALYGYLGILPLILAFLAVFRLFRKPYVLIFIVLTGIAFLWGIGKTTQFFSLFWETIPGMKFFRYPVKILFFIEFTLAVLAGFGLDHFLKFFQEKKPTLKRFVPYLALALVLVVFVDLYFNNCLYIQPIIDGKDWFSPPQSAQFLQKELEKDFFRIYSHGSNNLDYNLARDVAMQKEFKNLLFIDFNMVYKIPANREWFVLLRDWHMKLNKTNAQLDFAKASISLPPELKKSLSLQRVKYIVSDLPVEDESLELIEKIPFSQTVDHYAFVITPEGMKTTTVPATATWLYENKEVYPHILLVHQARVIENEEEALGVVLSEDFKPEREVILEKELRNQVSSLPAGKAGIKYQVSKGEVRVVDYQNNEVVIEVKAGQPGFVVLADSYYPGWRAWVDGKETEILRANYAFRAITVAEGEHRIKMKFEPTFFKPTALISALTLILTLFGLAFLSLWPRLSQREKTKSSQK